MLIKLIKDSRRDIFNIFRAVLPVFCVSMFGILFLLILRRDYDPVLLFSLFVVPQFFLHLIVGPVVAGVVVITASFLGIVGSILTIGTWDSALFIADVGMFWWFFYQIESIREEKHSTQHYWYERRERLEIVSNTWKERITETKNLLKVLQVRLSNYQRLGEFTRSLMGNLKTDTLMSLVRQTFPSFIGRGALVVKLFPADYVPEDTYEKWVLDNKRALLIKDTSTDVRFPQQLEEYANSILFAPLIIHNDVIGIVRFFSAEPNVYGEEDLRLLNVLVDHTILGLSNAQLYEEIESLAITDDLTGLYVRSFFEERLEELFSRAIHERAPLSIAFFDLDRFKLVNDKHGHPAGDEVLRCFSQILRENVRETDILGRYGGEEFVCLMPQTDIQQAIAAAEKIRTAVFTYRFPVAGKHTGHVSVSVGVAEVQPHMKDASSLMATVDAALYKSKSSGRNCVSTA